MAEHNHRKAINMLFIKEILILCFLLCCIKLANSWQLCTGKEAAVTRFSVVNMTSESKKGREHHGTQLKGLKL